MINRVVLVGRLTREPELRFLPSGVPVAKFAIAVNRPFSNKEGDREVDFFDVTVWRKTAENCASYLDKGSLVSIDGRLRQERWEKDGKNYSRVEVIADFVQFLDTKKEGNTSRGRATSNPDKLGIEVNVDDNDLPF